MNNYLGFDPLVFLGISNIKAEDKENLNHEIFNSLSQYLVIRLAELLPTQELEKTNDITELFALAEKTIPDFKDKIKSFLTDFKQEFNSKKN
ncbi:hypothetical protein HY404_01690 [Candidatus Microgenomates bacterium]|nr:hypothetical protein [Candidatus Microgenomates bacterium]